MPRGRDKRNIMLIVILITFFLLISFLEAVIILNSPSPIAEVSARSNTLLEDPGVNQSAKFNPPHSYYCSDSDQDGKFDLLTLNVSLTVNSSSSFTIHSYFYYDEPDGSEMFFYNGAQAESETINLSSGNYTIPLNFSTIMIQRYNRSGIWIINMSLVDEAAYQIVDRDGYITDSLDCDEFDPLPAELLDLIEEYGIDEDSDDTYDWVVVNVTIEVFENGLYNTSGSINDADWETLAVDNNSYDLQNGNQTTQLWFNVSANSVAEGPYQVGVIIRYNDQIYCERIYETSMSTFHY